MKRRTILVMCSLALAAALSRAQSAAVDKSEQLRDAMRTLWDDHVVWTRLFIVSTLGDLPDAQATTERLLQNQTDIGNAIKPYYGEAAGTKLTGLLREHILIAADIVKGAKAGDTAKVDAAKAKWTANADEIAAFLSGANAKNWPAAEMKTMMHDHLAATTTELEMRLKKDWKGDIAAFDRVEEQIMRMADMLSDGIIKQFPDKFA
jgi:hypothetical protein